MNIDNLLDDLRIKRDYLARRLVDEPLPSCDGAPSAVKCEIAALGLEDHVLALETDGYTVLSPEEVDAGDLIDRLNTTVDRVVEERRRKKRGLTPQPTLGTLALHLVPEDPVFQEVLMVRKPLALLTYLLGYHAKLNQCTAVLKPKGEPALRFHADSYGKFPKPWPTAAQLANVTWALDDYTREGGCLAVVPGSHRHDPPDISMSHDDESVVAVEAPKGSVIVWHGNLWHGAFERKIDGLRRTLILYHSRSYIESEEMYKHTTTLEMLERNPARFGVLMGITDPWPWGVDGPDASVPPIGGTDQFE